jgi:hypothetical protein
MKTKIMHLSSDMQELMEIVESHFNVKLMSNRRKREIVDARMIFAKILRERGHTYQTIADFMYKDHSTIIHYVQQATGLIKNNRGVMDMYMLCKNKFMENRDPVVLYTDRDLVKEVLSLREQIDELIADYENVRGIEKKYKRLEHIINLIDSRTPLGSENLIKRKINELFNGL